MKINPFNLATLNLGQIFQFIDRVIILIKDVGAEKLKISAQFNNLLLPAFQKLDVAYKKGRKSSLTAKITDARKLRDDTIRGISGIVKAMMKNTNKELSDAAKEIKVLLETFKKITKKPLNEQTADTTNLLQDFNGKYAEFAQTLGLTNWIEDLERINNDIISKLALRDKETAEKNKINSGVAKKDIISAYGIICKQLEVNVKTEGSDNYADFIQNLNVIISKAGGRSASSAGNSSNSNSGNNNTGTGEEEKYPDAREWSEDIDYQTCASGDIFYIVRNGIKEYYKLLDFGEVATFEPGMDDGGIWEKL